jgi:hypothetical protein
MTSTDPQDGPPAHSVLLTTHDGLRVADPDAAAVEDVLRTLSEDDWFAVLDRGEEHYVQVPARPAPYLLEHRDGSADRHVGTEVTDLDDVVAAFVAFARGDGTWRGRFSWRPVEL